MLGSQKTNDNNRKKTDIPESANYKNAS